MPTIMKRHPNLRGRYEGSVFSPLQWGLLAAIGYLFVLGLQVDTLLHTSFSLELFDHEVARVEHPARPAVQHAWPRRVTACGEPMSIQVLDWPKPPMPTSWTPKTRSFADAAGAASDGVTP